MKTVRSESGVPEVFLQDIGPNVSAVLLRTVARLARAGHEIVPSTSREW